MAKNNHSSQLFLKMGKQSNGGVWSANTKVEVAVQNTSKGFKRLKFQTHNGHLQEGGSFFSELELIAHSARFIF